MLALWGFARLGSLKAAKVKIMKINGGHQSSFGLFSCTEMGGNSFPVTSKYATSAPHDSIAKQEIALTPRRVSL
jgi:hypothetical protein